MALDATQLAMYQVTLDSVYNFFPLIFILFFGVFVFLFVKKLTRFVLYGDTVSKELASPFKVPAKPITKIPAFPLSNTLILKCSACGVSTKDVYIVKHSTGERIYCGDCVHDNGFFICSK